MAEKRTRIHAIDVIYSLQIKTDSLQIKTVWIQQKVHNPYNNDTFFITP